MNIRRKLIISTTLCFLVSGYTYANENIELNGHSKTSHSVMANGCTQDLGAAILQVNNVRARIMDEGDMWWDPGTNCNYYYVPANGNVSAQFAAALWVGGYDAGNQLKVAAMTYRQNGEDFWAGPIDTTTGGITSTECNTWDKMFYVTRAEVQKFVTDYPNGGAPAGAIPLDISLWPGSGVDNGSPDASNHMAPFVDVGGDGYYDPEKGDYPAFDLTGNGNCQDELYGDACLWWVINDVGNIHTESGGVPIGLEIREQAFGFQTNDAIDNMTFYHYKIINRSTFALYKTYFGFWNDFDLGNGNDNYVGCDVGRSMGYGYAASNYDADGSGAYACEKGYHADPAAVGDVFFQGPEADKGDTGCYIKLINNKEIIGMAKFVYYNNDFTVMGNPLNQTSYYKYLTGFWQDGTPMTYGGTGYGGSLKCNYMFPWTPINALGSGKAQNTDIPGCGTGGIEQFTEWDEYNQKNPAGDRRLLMSAGPFTLTPGAVNYVIVGCVWDRPGANNLGNTYPIGLIQQDADLAQGLFNNCFKVVNGPDAPDVTVQELNNEIILTLSNSPTSNNYKEHYTEKSPTILPPFTKTNYDFQGYEIFQLIDSTVTASELLDATKARLVAQCDIQDSVAQIINYVYNSTLNAVTPTLEVSGANKGISHAFDLKTDAFQLDNQTSLVNDRPYYYMAIAYAFNNYFPYNQTTDTNIRYGQKLPFLQGRRNIQVYTAYPHIPEAQSYGTVQNSVFGTGVPVTRIEGHGNGFNTIELDQNSINYILANDTMAHVTYIAGQGPITVKVVDPLNVVAGNFVVKFDTSSTGVSNSTKWELDYYNPTTGQKEVTSSDTTIGYDYEQIFPQYGISVTIQNVPYPGAENALAIDSNCSITFTDPYKNWLTFVPSAAPGANLLYWIRSGVRADPSATSDPDGAFISYPEYTNPKTLQVYNYDPNQFYNQILGGTWSPYTLAAVSSATQDCDNGPSYGETGVTIAADSIGNIASVDIVLTADKSKWTRCVVLEEQDATVLAEGGAAKLDLRKEYSIDQSGQFYSGSLTDTSSSPGDANYISPTGMGWFPGYVINLETGERLNMAYGEDSWLSSHGGRDMQWDPDSIVFQAGGTSGAGNYFGVSSVFGGKHYIYVFGHNNNISQGYDYSIPVYDNGQTLVRDLNPTRILPHPGSWWKERVLDDVMWVSIPLLNRGHSLLETDATIRLRVAKPYDTSYGETYLNLGHGSKHSASLWRNPKPDNNNFPMYSFSTDGLEVVTNNATAANAALSLINVVPNPYYAYAGYENSALDTRVRITNLPPVCTISIFTLSGTLITVINKNNPQTYTDWNLQNQYNVPIASGLYLIHVAVPNVGEVTLKWFGVMRPLDLTTY